MNLFERLEHRRQDREDAQEARDADMAANQTAEARDNRTTPRVYVPEPTDEQHAIWAAQKARQTADAAARHGMTVEEFDAYAVRENEERDARIFAQRRAERWALPERGRGRTGELMARWAIVIVAALILWGIAYGRGADMAYREFCEEYDITTAWECR